MSFCTFSKEFSDSSFTGVENKFILKYMPQADGTAVKVYLYGLYLCRNSTRDFSLENCAEMLHLSPEQVREAFLFWEDCDLVQIICEEPFTLQYLPVDSALGKPKKVRFEQYADFNKELQRKMQSAGVFLDYSAMQKYMNFLQNNDMEQQAFLLIVEYCIQRNGGTVSHAEIFNKAKNFIKRGFLTYSQVEKALSDFNVHTTDVKRVLSALSITREPCESDYALVEKWTANGMEIGAVTEGAKQLQRGTMQGLDSIVEELLSHGITTQRDAADYLAERKMLTTLTYRIAKSLGVKVGSPAVYTDEYTQKWFNYGFEEGSLTALAVFCVKTERASFPDLDELIDGLYHDGVVSEESVENYLENAYKDLKLISKIQKYCMGVRRSQAVLQMVGVWHEWNFSDEMILEAAKQASSTARPIAYINKVLSEWKLANVYSVESIPDAPKQTAQKVFINPNVQALNDKTDRERYYAEHRAKAQSIADKAEQKALSDPEYKTIALSILELERETAKAEVFSPETLPSLMARLNGLKAQKSALLSGMGMSEEDFIPKYECKKCSDTGYLPSGKMCDCYRK